MNYLVDELLKDRTHPNKISIRVDGGKVENTSFGHLHRMLLLAENISLSNNVEIVFLMKNYYEGVSLVKKNNFKVVLIENNEKDDVRKLLNIFKPDWFIVDIFYKNRIFNYFENLENSYKILIDDYGNDKIINNADVIVNSNDWITKDNYKYSKEGVNYLLGIEYLIMENIDYSISLPFQNENSLKILITFGGSDPTGLTEKVVDLLLLYKFKQDIHFYVVTGPGFGDFSNLEKKIEKNRMFFHIDFPKSLLSLVNSSDIVICAGGRTLTEAIILKKNILAISSAKHEDMAIDYYSKKYSNVLKTETEKLINKLECFL